MRAYLIDPVAKTVTAVEHKGDLASVLALLDVDMIDAVRLGNGDVIYVDDEGLLKPGQSFFWNPHWHRNPLAGRGLIVGSRDDGHDDEPATDLEDIRCVFLRVADQSIGIWERVGSFPDTL